MKIIADENIPFVKECFSTVGEVYTLSGRDMNAEIVRGADVLLVRSITKVKTDLLEGSKVRFVGTATIGTEHVDQAYLAENRIAFASAPGSNADSVAEYITAAILEIFCDRAEELTGKTIGIIGAGNVGSRVENRVRALGMVPYLNDPPLYRQTRNPKYMSLEKMLECDVVTLHTPLTFEGDDKTFHLADESFFAGLRPGSIFINSARGGVTDTGALKEALRTGKISAAVLDVWEKEPAIDPEIMEMADLATPHIAGYSFDGKVRGMIMLYQSLCGHLGIPAEKTERDFLPPADKPQIEIQISESEQNAMRDAVRQVYDIREDDENLRQSAGMSDYERGGYFDKLRKTYRRRREFPNTQVILEDGSTTLIGKLRGIGFGVG